MRPVSIIARAHLLSRYDGDTATVIQVLSDTINSIREFFPLLTKLKNEDDGRTHKRIVHNIHGALQLCGAITFAERLHTIESQLPNPAYRVQDSVSEIQQMLLDACNAASALVDELKDSAIESI